MVHQVLQVLQEQAVLTVVQELQVQMVHLEQVEFQVLTVLRELVGLQEHRVQAD